MIVQTHFPHKLSAKRYDQYLASGWFRGSVMLYKMDILCLDTHVYSVVNIRLNMAKHENKRRLAKTLRRNREKFRITIDSVKLNSAKESLYNKQKKKFHGFIHNSLHDFLYSGFRNTVFDTKELCVYEGDKLVACSYFDIGEKGIASLLGIHDEDYASSSLGIYTMLEEIEYAKTNGYKWYYPGYILNGHKGFDYKLRLGDYEFYNSNKRWAKLTHFDPENLTDQIVNRMNVKLENVLKENQIDYKKWVYPYFGIGYMNMWEMSFLKIPVVMEIGVNKSGDKLLAAYSIEEKEYHIFWSKHAKGYEGMINMDLSTKAQNNDELLLKLHTEETVLLKTMDLTEVLDFVNELKRNI